MSKIDNPEFLDLSRYLGKGAHAIFSLSRAGDMKDENIINDFVKRQFGDAGLICSEQVHKTTVSCVDIRTKVPVPDSDGLITKDRNVVLGVFTADCIPVFLYDEVSGLAGLLHAGWRGISKNFIISAVDFIQKNSPVYVSSLKVVIGPGLCVRHFEVSAELAHVFPGMFIRKKKEKSFVDLKKIIKKQFVDSGVQQGNIYDAGLCSFEEKNIFSLRREQTEKRNCAFIKLL
ncbi:MAG: polyphenol oxidase family protein [bacterium]